MEPSVLLDKQPVGLNLAPAHALEINVDAEVTEQVWAICLPGRCFTKSSRCIGESCKSSELKRIFPIASFFCSPWVICKAPVLYAICWWRRYWCMGGTIHCAWLFYPLLNVPHPWRSGSIPQFLMTAKNALAFPDVLWKMVPLEKTPAIQESTHLYIVLLPGSLSSLNFSLNKYCFLLHPQSGSENVTGCPLQKIVLETPFVTRFSLWNRVVLAVKNAHPGTRVCGIIFCLDHLLAVGPGVS